eukprot:SAG31_NODE_12106_length_968_cov_0.845800_1_plen_123_part_00
MSCAHQPDRSADCLTFAGRCAAATPAEQTACGTPPPREDLSPADLGTLIRFEGKPAPHLLQWPVIEKKLKILSWELIPCADYVRRVFQTGRRVVEIHGQPTMAGSMLTCRGTLSGTEGTSTP